MKKNTNSEGLSFNLFDVFLLNLLGCADLELVLHLTGPFVQKADHVEKVRVTVTMLASVRMD